jgi:4-amino-4-deoxy-L-arabinose transferase-like glycosyltransferase
LIFAVILILIFSPDQHFGDEPRYLFYAKNLTQGYFSPSYPHIDLGNGPGYPIVISPFVALNAPLLFLRLLNPIFYYFSIVFLYKALKNVVSPKFTFVFSLIWALYPNTLEELPRALPEIFATSLISVFIYCIIKGFDKTNTRQIRYLIASGLTFGYLILTKPIFAYVMLFLFFFILILWFFKRRNKDYKNSLVVIIIAFILNIPYLAYTYSLTGKLFYWSSFGGNNLYWMSSPYPEEYGSYYRFPFRASDDRIPGSEKIIARHHQKDFEEMLKNPEVRKANIINGDIQQDLSNGITQDDLLKEMAIENIKAHPFKFMQNCISNAGRMLFNYPAAYVLQKPSTLSRLPINGTLLVFIGFCLIPTLINWKRIFFSIRFLLFFSLLYFGGSLLGSAEPRMFTKIVPILLIWIALILLKAVKVKLKFD